MDNTSRFTAIRSTLSTAITSLFNGVVIWLANAILSIRRAWYRANTPADILREDAEYQRISNRLQLEVALVLGVFFGILSVASGFLLLTELPFTADWFHQTEFEYPGGWGELLLAMILFGNIGNRFLDYRVALAAGQLERFHEEEDRRARAFRNLVFSAIAVIALSAAIQRIPGLEQQLPWAVEAADWVIDTVNNLMPTFMQWINDLFARAIEKLPF